MKVVVVGGGVVGLASAYELASAGCEVTLLESGKCGAGASHGNAAKVALAESTPVPGPGVLLQGIKWMLRPDSPLSIKPSLAPGYLKFLLRMAQHCNTKDFKAGLDVHLRLGEDANALFDDYQGQGMDFEMHARGVLLAFETAERFEEHSLTLDAFASAGHVAEELHGDDLLEAEPALSDSVRHGLFFPTDRQIEPDSLTRGLLAKLVDLGVRVREGVTVRSFVRSSDTVTAAVMTDAEVIATDAVVVAAGVTTGELLAKLGRRLPIYSGKGYSIDYAPPPIKLRTSLTLEDARVAVTPLNGLLRLAGTMEFGSRDDEVDDVRVDAIRGAARRSFRDWGDEPTGERIPWAGSRPMTPDGLPMIGRLGTAKNAYVNSGHSMLGLTLAPASAKVLTDIILGRRSTLSSDLLARISPQRF